jgi:hypothetical protein
MPNQHISHRTKELLPRLEKRLKNDSHSKIIEIAVIRLANETGELLTEEKEELAWAL